MLELHVLGQFELRQDGAAIVLPSRPAQSLLAYLALSAGTAHRREKLAGLLWPDADEDNARNSLRHALWRIRKAIERDQAGAPYLLSDDLAVSFNAGADYWLDAAVLVREAKTLQEELEAVAVYRGELLPGFYDDWVTLERQRLESVLQHKMPRLLDRFSEEARWPEVLEWAERWVALGHAPEPGYRALMQAHAALGDRAQVAQVYQRCREALFNEVGVEPSAATRRLYAQLCRDDTEAALQPAPPHANGRDEAPAPGEPPFQGLQYFDEADADRFFGRERLSAQLVRRLNAEPFLAVIGASGSGKSSVVRAGLLPALRRAGASEVCVLTPTAHPLEELARWLLPDGQHSNAPGRAAMLEELGRDPGGLRRVLARRPRAGRHLVLVIDQFEELFALCRDRFEREAMIENLLGAVDLEGPASIVIALRADFYAHCAEYGRLRQAVAEHQEYVGPMAAAELRRAIEGPAEQGGWTFEAGLVDILLRDVGEEPGGLPLLSHALLETWRRRKGRQLSLAGYAAAGGVQGAIAQTADALFAQRLSAAQQRVARNIFLHLTELGEGTPDTRRRANIDELVGRPEDAALVREVLQLLADARLITLDQSVAEVAHEALIREWPSLREWLDEDREGLRLRRQLQSAAQEWDRLGRDTGLLYRGVRLSQALEVAREHRDELTPIVQTFVATSQEAAEREVAEREGQQRRELEVARTLAESQRRAAVQLRRRALVLAGALLLALGTTAAALFFGDQAQRSARLTTARELASTAITQLDVDPERSILVALEAVRSTQPTTTEAEVALHQAVEASRTRLTLRGHTDRVLAATFSPDGSRVVTGSRDDTATVWDAQSGAAVLALAGHTDQINAAVFSPDGARIATASSDHTTRLWDAATGAPVLTLDGHTDAVHGVAFSPDARRLATASGDGTARVWDATTGQEQLRLTASTSPTLAIAFSPDGRRILTGGQDQMARVWDATTGEEVLSLVGHTGAVAGVAYSPDGRLIATTGGDFTLRVWDAASGRALHTEVRSGCYLQTVAFSPDSTRLGLANYCGSATVLDVATWRELFALRGHVTSIFQIAFSPDGERLVTASGDNTARVWDASPGGNELLTLATSTATVFDVEFSPDGRQLATAGWDGAARVWDVATGAEVRTLSDHMAEVNAVAFSPDGSRLATPSSDGTGRVWDLASGQARVLLVGHEPLLVAPQFTVGRAFNGLIDIAFSPDGARLATSGGDGTARLWNAETGQQQLVLRGHRAPVNTVAFSPDGKLLATGSDDETVRLWDTATGDEVRTITGQTQRVWEVAFAPDGKHLATSSTDGAPKVWDVMTGQPIFTLGGQAGTVRMRYTPDGTRLVTPGADGTTKVWAASTGQELLTLSFPDGVGAVRAAVSSDESRLAVAGSNGLVRVYLLRLEDLVSLAHARLTRSWTLEECQRFLHMEHCPA